MRWRASGLEPSYKRLRVECNPLNAHQLKENIMAKRKPTSSSFIKLIKYKDGSFCWKEGDNTTAPSTKSNAIAFGAWFLRFRREELIKSLDDISKYQYNDAMSLFSSYGDYLYSDAVNIKREEG